MTSGRRTKWTFAALALLGITTACQALVGDTAQCKTDADCAVFGAGHACGPEGTCVARVSAIDAGDAASASDTGTTPTAGPLASISLSPTVASVGVGLTQQFTATGLDAKGNPASPAPTFTWSVTGGGTIGTGGLFAAGPTAGGPFTVTVASGAISATATVTVTQKTTTVTIGETTVLANDDSGNANILLAQQATLAQAATLRSLSFYVAEAAGNLRLGVYDDTGPNGGPGAKKAETAEFAAAKGWTAVNVITPVALPKGNYWLAYLPNSNDLHFNLSDDGQGMLAYFNQPYGPLPATFSTTPTLQNRHWSFYATLTVP